MYKHQDEFVDDKPFVGELFESDSESLSLKDSILNFSFFQYTVEFIGN